MDVQVGNQLVINAPEFFEDLGFRQWLIAQDKPAMTRHTKGDPFIDEWSDVIVLVDPSLSGEGSEKGEVPDHIWNAIIEICKQHFRPSPGVPHIAVRLTNLS
ncbi:hypothetical protein [Comamonas thiooxydans]|uniref:hypothetical protein n=1 Tax=Comamonas thiooxydans TaxID=363952 RepID=UPI001186D2D2|nr:hypothetical protein [Comamonas thiooxydans]